MTFPELAAALEERLIFYNAVLDKMEKAVISGDTEALAAYSQLEERTAREIAAHEKCFTARLVESRSDELIMKVNAAREKAGSASRRVCGLLSKEKEAVAAQIKSARGQDRGSGQPPGSLPPLVIDIEA